MWVSFPFPICAFFQVTKLACHPFSLCPRVLLNIPYISLAPLSIVDTRSCVQITATNLCRRGVKFSDINQSAFIEKLEKTNIPNINESQNVDDSVKKLTNVYTIVQRRVRK